MVSLVTGSAGRFSIESSVEYQTTRIGDPVPLPRYAPNEGNVIGSDIFNLLGVLRLAGLLRTLEIDAMAHVSRAAVCGTVFLGLFFMRTGWRVSRLQGIALLSIAASRWGLDPLARVPGL